MSDDRPFKIFGIGWNKTGTTTLAYCLRELGFGPLAPVANPELKNATRRLFKSGDYEPALRLAERFGCFEDRPWNVWEMYRHLDDRFPGSRFVLTVRESETWWRSVSRWLTYSKPWVLNTYCCHARIPSKIRDSLTGGRVLAMLKAYRGMGLTDEQAGRLRPLMIDAYERHNRQVIHYFRGRSDLLVVDFERGDGWEVLCPFLGVDIPSRPVPHRNRQHYDERDSEKRKNMLTKRFKRFLGR